MELKKMGYTASPQHSSEADSVNMPGGHYQLASTAGQQKNVSIPWKEIIALAMGMLLFGVAEGYGPITAFTNLIPSSWYYLSLSAGFIAGGFGALLAGFLTDKLGRRKSFLVSAAIALIGVGMFIGLPGNPFAVVASFVLVGMVGIGMETPILATLSESISAKYRGNLLVVVQDFGNMAAVEFIPAVIGLSAVQSRLTYTLLILAPLIALSVGYFSVKETLPWEAIKQRARTERAWQEVDQEPAEPVKPTAGIGFRLATVVLLGIVQDVAYTWVAIDVGYLYFPSYCSLIPMLIGFISAAFGIFYGIFVVNRMSRKTLAVLSYGLNLLLWLLLWAYVSLAHGSAGLPLLIIFASFSIPLELTWGVRALLEPELFATKKRGTYISITRAIVWIAAGLITMLLAIYFYPTTGSRLIPMFNASSAIVTAIFLTGATASIAWYLKGFETGNKSLAGHDLNI